MGERVDEGDIAVLVVSARRRVSRSPQHVVARCGHSLERHFNLFPQLGKERELVVVPHIPPSLAQCALDGRSSVPSDPRSLPPYPSPMFAVVVDRRRKQFCPQRLDKVVDLALRDRRDHEERGASVETGLTPDEGQSDVERRVVEEFARAEEDDGELDASFVGRPFPVDDFLHEAGISFSLLLLACRRVDGRAWWMFEQSENQDEDGGDEFAVFADPNRRDDAVGIERRGRREG